MDQRRALVTHYLEKQTETAVSWLLPTIGLSRNAWYHQPTVTKEADEVIVEQIKATLLESPYYGYRRVTESLKRQ